MSAAFHGRRSGEEAPSVVIRAVDSTFWEVFGSEDCLRKLAVQFTDVRPARPDAGDR